MGKNQKKKKKSNMDGKEHDIVERVEKQQNEEMLRLKQNKASSKMQYTKTKNKLLRMLESNACDYQIVEEMREKLATAVDSVTENIMKLNEFCISAAKFEEVEKYTEELELFTEEYGYADRKIQDCLDSVRDEIRSRRSKKSSISSKQSNVSARSKALRGLGHIEERKPLVKQLDKAYCAERMSELSDGQEGGAKTEKRKLRLNKEEYEFEEETRRIWG